MNRLRSFLKLLFQKQSMETDLDSEMNSFYETTVDRYLGQGIPEAEARRLARLRFGTQENAKEQVRDSRPGTMLLSIAADAKYALRSMRKAPAIALVTIFTLGIGIGANATIFSIINRLLLLHPPVGDPETLLALYTTHERECCNGFTWPAFMDLREQVKSFSGVAAYYELLPASMDGGGEPERVWGQAVTTNFFDVAQLPMTIGRGFMTHEDNLPVVVLSHAMWKSQFAADPEITGKMIRLSGYPFAVVGVSPPGFRGLDLVLSAQFWVPMGSLNQLLPNIANFVSRENHWITVAGRLANGVTRNQADAELKVISKRLVLAHPKDTDNGFHLETAGALPPRDRAKVMAFLAGISAIAFLVLCIACANVTNLSLARALSRRKEMALRLSLGAPTGRLMRLVLTESVLLSLAGGAIGVGLSLLATHRLGSFQIPAPVPLDLSVHVDWRVILYAFLLSAGAGLLFGLIPAWAVARPTLANTLKGEDILGPGRYFNLPNILVITQVAMSLVLLCATGIFLRSLDNATRIDIGFRSRGLIMMSVDPRLHGYSPDRIVQFLALVRERISALPGVVTASYTDAVPLSGGHRSESFQIEGGKVEGGIDANNTELYMVAHGYFETMGIERKAGRDFTDGIAAGAKVAVVNEAFAQALFSKENPLGQRVHGGGQTYEIIGVVKDTKSRTIGEKQRPVLFRSLEQTLAGDPSFSGYTILVRYSGGHGGLINAMRREIGALDPSLAVFKVATMEEHLRDALFLPRLAGTLFGVFGFIGLTLAAVGLYGLISYRVSRRLKEIGIRLAIGANVRAVQFLIIRQGMTLALIALVPGLVAAWALSKLFTNFLYGIAPNDMVSFTVAPAFLVLIAFLASWIPSRRAAKVNPSNTMRHE